ncbi:MAG: hypothetical protein V4677_16960 [Bacteroidota bacterium]
MKRSFFKYLLFAAAIALVTYACVKKTTYPTTPTIEFKDFIAFTGDSADLQITFKDGDGDIGVGESDVTPTFFYTYYYKDTVTNQYRAYYRPIPAPGDTLRIGYNVKSPSDSYKGKPINGEMSIRLQQSRHDDWVKNVKYVFYLLDAAGNKSNVVTSPEIILK